MLRLFNTATKHKEEFTPITQGKVGMYCCGPTVYHYAHIGNMRAYIFNDVLRRVLEFNNYQVEHVMNVTDVGHLSSDGDEGEDKMAKGAAREGKSVWDIAKYYEEAFFNDADALNIIRPTIICKATDHINEMIELNKKLEEKGFTYVADGNLYFDTSKFPRYSELANLKMDSDSEEFSRVGIDAAKKNKQDFVLWFTNSKFKNQEMQWDSPWGRGFPGWHLECSAMSMKYLGEQFDIHCGGEDHISIHHTNEIAQSEAATGKTPWVKTWMHNAFLVIESGKMSKSSGDFLTVSKLKSDGYEPLAFRYFCLSGHYKQQLKFNTEGMESAKNSFNRLKEKIITLKENHNPTAETAYDEAKMQQYIVQFYKATNDDLNTALGLSVLWAVLRDEEITDSEKLALSFTFDRVLGFGMKEMQREEVIVDAELQSLLDARESARVAKDWAKSDVLRDLIKEKGFIVKDGKEGQTLEKV